MIPQLTAEGPLLAAAAEHAGWDTHVPGTEWDVRQLITHIGGVHRWATEIGRGSRAEHATPGRRVGVGPATPNSSSGSVPASRPGRGAGLGARDLDAFTFLPADSPLEFWARRQAHETAIHRADAEGAAGESPDFGREFAQDGIAEILAFDAARVRDRPAGDASASTPATGRPG